MLMLPQIIAADPPCRILFPSQMTDPPFLFLPGNIQKQLYYQVPIVCQLTLKPLYTLDPLCVLLLRKFSLQISARQLSHPARIQEYKLSRFRDLRKMPVQKRLSGIFFRFLFHIKNLEEARINILDDAPDAGTLAGGSPAFHQYQDRNLFLLHLQLLHRQFLSGYLKSCFQLLLFRHLGRHPFSQHRNLLFLSSQPSGISYI